MQGCLVASTTILLTLLCTSYYDTQQQQQYQAPRIPIPTSPPHCNIPRVALLFLITTHPPVEPVWKPWLTAARTLLHQKQDAPCAPGIPSSSTWGPFRVHLHSSPNFKPEMGLPGSIFDGTEIPTRVPTAWGHHNCTVAFRLLLQHALQHQDSVVFTLLSDSDVPLYPPLLLYMQLLHEAPLSRVDCCAGQLGLDPEHNEQRFTPAMETPPVFTRQHWRKTFQWVVLHRKHAVMVATDQVVVGLFQRFCINAFDVHLGRWRDCLADEHYVASLLVSLGQEHECNCASASFSDWRQGGAHPRSWSIGELNTSTLHFMRTAGHVQPQCGISTSAYLEAARYAWKQQDPRLYSSDLMQCPLFARKVVE